MVRHMESGGDALDGGVLDGGALAEGVWDYVDRLIKAYRSLDTESCCEVSLDFFVLFRKNDNYGKSVAIL